MVLGDMGQYSTACSTISSTSMGISLPDGLFFVKCEVWMDKKSRKIISVTALCRRALLMACMARQHQYGHYPTLLATSLDATYPVRRFSAVACGRLEW